VHATKSFFDTDARTLALRLLGATLHRRFAPRRVATLRIVETEAYVGPEDACSHARNAKRTERNRAMFGPPGIAYVYFTYGMHHCFNVVCGNPDRPAAVLIRAAEPLRLAHLLRSAPHAKTPTSGPARLCRALDIDRRLDSIPLRPCAPLWISPGEPPRRVAVSARVGVSQGSPWTNAPLRFFDPESPWVSTRRGPYAGSILSDPAARPYHAASLFLRFGDRPTEG
jgi:DNA-3-methyladenine glycosylase